MPKQTKNCPYCSGRGYNISYGINSSWSTYCRDCKGTGQVCILCIKPSSLCECPESAFDETSEYGDRPTPPSP